MKIKQKIIVVIIATGFLLIAVFAKGLYNSSASQDRQTKGVQSTQNINPEIPYLVSTKPEGLKEGAIVIPTEIIEITFSHQIENKGEVKSQIDPQVEYEVELGNDRKTVLLKPKRPFSTGAGFTFIIKKDTKFDGGKRLEGDVDFHFNTIPHRGI